MKTHETKEEMTELKKSNMNHSVRKQRIKRLSNGTNFSQDVKKNVDTEKSKQSSKMRGTIFSSKGHRNLYPSSLTTGGPNMKKTTKVVSSKETTTSKNAKTKIKSSKKSIFRPSSILYSKGDIHSLAKEKEDALQMLNELERSWNIKGNYHHFI